MSVHVNYQDWNSAEECLQWLFDNHKDMKHYGSIHVWQESFATLGGCMKAGSYRTLTPNMLKDRNYKVFFVNDSIGICYYDVVFISLIQNRDYPAQKTCILARLPYI